MKLLPCPFCGGEANYIERKNDEAKYAVGCSNDNCIIWIPSDIDLKFLHNYAMCYVDFDDMVKAWHTRVEGEE